MTMLRVNGALGAPISAIDEGSGPAILIVHPGGGDAFSWAGVAELLNDEFRIVRLQRRLYAADASEVQSPHTMAAEVADILAVASRLSRPILVGHSSGAVAALEAALEVPQAFSGMVLYEPPLATTSPVAGEAGKRARAALEAGDPVKAMEIHLRDIVQLEPAMVDAIFARPEMQARFARQAAAQLADNDALDALGVGIDRYAALDLPTVLIGGERSPAHLRGRLADLATTLPHVVRVVTLKGEGHTANLTAADQLADVIRNFARDVAP
jgi:pimeloyl-ACP methyl ester carboxylesterase